MEAQDLVQACREAAALPAVHSAVAVTPLAVAVHSAAVAVAVHSAEAATEAEAMVVVADKSLRKDFFIQ